MTHISGRKDAEGLAGFWADAAHDMRQPLQALTFLADALILKTRRCGADDDGKAHALSLRVAQSLQMLDKMFETLSLLAGLSAGRRAPAPERLDAAALCQAAVNMETAQKIAQALNQRLVLAARPSPFSADRNYVSWLLQHCLFHVLNQSAPQKVGIDCRPAPSGRAKAQITFSYVPIGTMGQKGQDVFQEARAAFCEAGGSSMIFGPALLEKFAGCLGGQIAFAHGKTCKITLTF